MTKLPKKFTDDPHGAAILIRRLVTAGAAYWRHYLLAFTLMATSAAATAVFGYILGQVINKAYVDKECTASRSVRSNRPALHPRGGGPTVARSSVENLDAILANDQRRLFSQVIDESVAFFSEQHRRIC